MSRGIVRMSPQVARHSVSAASRLVSRLWALAFWVSPIGITNCGREGKGAFLRLCVSGPVRGEAGETVDPEPAAPDFSPKLMNDLLGGSARAFGTSSPFGLRQQTVLGMAEGALRRNQQQSVSGHAQSGSRFDGCGRAHLRLAHTQQGLFVAEVHLDIPALEISFDDLARVQFRIGADEVGRIAIKQLGAFAGAVGQGGDDNQLQNLLGSGGAPHNILEAFEAELMNYTGMRE